MGSRNRAFQLRERTPGWPVAARALVSRWRTDGRPTVLPARLSAEQVKQAVREIVGPRS